MGDKRSGGQRRPSNEGEACATAHAANSRTEKKRVKNSKKKLQYQHLTDFQKNPIELRITRCGLKQSALTQPRSYSRQGLARTWPAHTSPTLSPRGLDPVANFPCLQAPQDTPAGDLRDFCSCSPIPLELCTQHAIKPNATIR